MQVVREWGRRRPWTLGLAAFFLAWYILQISVFHLAGEDVARWWFYFQKPPNIVSSGVLLAPLSHDFYTLTHIGSNVPLLLVVGGIAEPYIGRDRILITVLGFGYLSVYLANGTAVVHKMWMLAGASGGILALGGYTGLYLRHEAFDYMKDGLMASWQGVETVVVMTLFLGIPVGLFHQTVWISQPHSGHTLGLLLGCVYYGVESYAVRFERVSSY